MGTPIDYRWRHETFAKPGVELSGYAEPKNPIGTVAELFAGVGGFRIGLARAGWQTIFSNQWEPSTKAQAASDVYVHRFGNAGHTNNDIAKVLDDYEAGKIGIPETTLLVGGFPCQDYSVAKSLNSSEGLVGKKGVLWWEILRLVRLNEPKLILLENVDRLLKSPASKRGRDFAVMLASLCDLGYMVEWRVVNAAEYGFPQRRKRVFIVAKKLDTFPIPQNWNAIKYIYSAGTLAHALPVVLPEGNSSTKKSAADQDGLSFELPEEISVISSEFGAIKGQSKFRSAGVIVGRKVTSFDVESHWHEKGKLESVLLPKSAIDESFFVSEEQLPAWQYLKGAKKEARKHAGSGEEYFYTEGSMAFPDLPENPSRTILTGEGGSSPSRFKHIIMMESDQFRRLTPIELERLNGFPDDWTKESINGEVSDSRRAFFMGNALVIGVVERIGNELAKEWKKVKAIKN